MTIKAFIAYSFTDKNDFINFNKKLRKFLKENFDIKSYSFVFDFKKKANNKNLMRSALKKIDESDLLIVELSNKAIGIGLEAGYAKAKGKKIIYLHKIRSEISTTIDGISDIKIEYINIAHLFVQLIKKKNMILKLLEERPL
ncbi:MAG: hypothetical protein ABIC96_01435 [Patescibacteria group bacterium]